MLVRGVRIDGEEAAAWRLAGRAVAAEAVLPLALEIAADMAQNCSPLVMGMHKRLLCAGWRWGARTSSRWRRARCTTACASPMRWRAAWLTWRSAPALDGHYAARWPEFL